MLLHLKHILSASLCVCVLHLWTKYRKTAKVSLIVLVFNAVTIDYYPRGCRKLKGSMVHTACSSHSGCSLPSFPLAGGIQVLTGPGNCARQVHPLLFKISLC